MRSIHDNNIYSLEVRCEQECIVLHTEFLVGESPEFTDIEFNGVKGHHFENVLEGNILFGIEESTSEEFYKENTATLEAYGRFGLPLSVKTKQEFVEDISKNNLKIFVISSSYGLTGWVISEGMELLEKSGKMA
jgi:hypothetical protein